MNLRASPPKCNLYSCLRVSFESHTKNTPSYSAAAPSLVLQDPITEVRCPNSGTVALNAATARLTTYPVCITGTEILKEGDETTEREWQMNGSGSCRL